MESYLTPKRRIMLLVFILNTFSKSILLKVYICVANKKQSEIFLAQFLYTITVIQ